VRINSHKFHVRFKFMMYNNKGNQRSRMRKLSHEKLGYMHDEELNRTYHTLKEAIENQRRRQRSASFAEIEMCYLQREITKRELRKKIHRDYLSSLRNRRRPNL
jgi:hypothetical protein